MNSLMSLRAKRCHCEERSLRRSNPPSPEDCFAPLAMTLERGDCFAAIAARNDMYGREA